MYQRRRASALVFIFTILFVGILGRIFYFQIIRNKDLTREAVEQRAIDTTLKVARGNIYDRNMIPFTDTEDRLYIIVVPNLLKNFESVARVLSDMTGYSIREITTTLKDMRPVTFILNEYSEKDVERLQYPGIKTIRLSKRYGNHSLARHLIGYINHTDQIGYAGIEKAYNDVLTVHKTQSIGMIGDAVKRSIPGLGYRVTNCFNETNTLGIRLTLDFHIQKIVEEVMDMSVQSGAVVVVDTRTGDVLALASRPNYSQDYLEQYVDGEGSELVNKAFSAYNLGSIFKIIVTAAALEDKVVSPETLLNCTGYINVDGKVFKCSGPEEGHGEVNFFHAFADSCNTSFIDTGLKTGYKPIVNMAKRFGLGQRVDLVKGLDQHDGYIPDNKYVSSREIANISIGQGEILATPIQIVDIVTTIANGGVRKRLNIIDAIVTDIGNVVTPVNYRVDTRIIGAAVNREIQKMMEEVTISGTGIRANLTEYGGAAGKTGSAETGWVTNGEIKVHAWFVGYFPITKPRYAIVVFVENGRWGGSKAAPIFKEIAEKIMILNR